MHKAIKDITGQRFGKFIVRGISHKNNCNHYMWECECDCGNIKAVDGSNLRNGSSKSCGCELGKNMVLTFDKFMSNVYPEPNTGCWLWAGKLSPDGYGNCAIPKLKLQRSHRISYYFHRGIFDTTLQVLHKCDNRICVNPDHLFLGTSLDNMLDRDSKNRHANKERHGMAKLSESLVSEIRMKYSKGGITQKELANQYSVSTYAIYGVVNNKYWKNVN